MLKKPPGIYAKILILLALGSLALWAGAELFDVHPPPSWVFYALLAVAALAAGLLFRSLSKPAGNLAEQYRKNLLLPELKAAITDLDYRPDSGFEEGVTQRLAFWKRNSYSAVLGDSYIRGSYKGMGFEFANMRLIKQSKQAAQPGRQAHEPGRDDEPGQRYLFRGIMLRTPAPDMAGIYIIARELRSQFANPFRRVSDELLHNGIGWYGMQISDSEMHMRYLAFANKRQRSMPPSFERLLAAANTARELTGAPAGLAVQDGSLWLVVDTGDDGLFRLEMKQDQRQRLAKDMETLTGLLEAMHGLSEGEAMVNQ